MPGIFTKSLSRSHSSHRQLLLRKRHSSVVSSTTTAARCSTSDTKSVRQQQYHEEDKPRIFRRNSTASSTESSNASSSVNEENPIHPLLEVSLVTTRAHCQQPRPPQQQKQCLSKTWTSSTPPSDDGWGHFVDITW